MPTKSNDSDHGEASGRIAVSFQLQASGFSDLELNHRVSMPVAAEVGALKGDGASKGDGALMDEGVAVGLSRLLAREHAMMQRISRWFLRIAQWKANHREELDLLLEQDVAMHLDVDSDESRLTVTFRAEYLAGSLKPLVQAVTFPLVGEVPSEEQVIDKLNDEWAKLSRIFTLARVAGDGLVTKAVPLPFVDSKQRADQGTGTDQDMQPLARVATPEEAKKLIENYLDLFRFPIEVEENGVRYGFIPRVEVCGGGNTIQLTVTMLMPPATGQGTFLKGGFKSVELPVDEIFVRGEELNRRTQEGVLGIVKGLCRSVGREKGMTGDIDITRPH